MTEFTQELLLCRRELYAYALHLAKNSPDAEDLVQETILRALEHRNQFKTGSNMSAWLFTILRNRHYSVGRKKQSAWAYEEWHARAGNQYLEPAQESSVMFKQTLETANQLPETQRKTVLALSLGMTYEEIAHAEGVPLGTIKSRMNRGRAALLKTLGEDS